MLLSSAPGRIGVPALITAILSIGTANFVTVSQDPEATCAHYLDIESNHEAAQEIEN